MNKDNFMKILSRLLHPHYIIIILLSVISAAGLCYVFLNGLDET